MGGADSDPWTGKVELASGQARPAPKASRPAPKENFETACLRPQADKDMVEDPQFWEDNNIGLAVSGNAGYISGEHGPWFNYPAGRLAINVPIMVADR